MILASAGTAILSFILLLLGLGLPITVVVMLLSWRSKMIQLGKDLERVKGRLVLAERQLKEGAATTPARTLAAVASPATTAQIGVPITPPPVEAPPIPAHATVPVPLPLPPVLTSLPVADSESVAKPSSSMMAFSGEKLIVWIAGLAALLGAFFMVQYAIANGWMNPAVRIVLTYLFGAGAVAGGFVLVGKPAIANSRRIGRALMGAGVAAFYFASYALSVLYGFAPQWVSFILMCGVTVGGVWLALTRGGRLMSVLALIGGMLTPVLVGKASDSAMFFSLYLTVLSLAFLLIARRLQFMPLLIMSLVLTAIQAVVYLKFNYHAYDSAWLSLMLILPAVVVVVRRPWLKSEYTVYAELLAVVLSVLFALMCLPAGVYGWLEWGLLFMLMIGLLVLVFLRPKETWYYVLLLLMGVCLIGCHSGMVASKACATEMHQWVYWILASCLLVPFYVALWWQRAAKWAIHVTVAIPVLFVYYLGWQNYLNNTELLLWLAIVGVMVAACMRLTHTQDHQRAGSGIILCATVLVSILAGLLLHRNGVDMNYFVSVLAAEALVLGVVTRCCPFPRMAWGVLVLSVAFMFCQWYPLVTWAEFLLSGSIRLLRYDYSLHFFMAKIILPALCYGVLAYISMGRRVRLGASVVVGVLALMGGFYAYMVGQMELAGVKELAPNFVESGFFTLLFLAGGIVGYLRTGSLRWSILFCLGLYRLLPPFPPVLWPLLTEDLETPLWSLCLIYGSGTALLVWAACLMEKVRPDFYVALAWLASFSSFVCVNAVLTKVLCGTICLKAVVLPEYGAFVYSVAWLMLAIVWMVCAFKRNVMIKPAFTLIYLTVVKVFVIDVSALSGGWRVLAFFALAACLFGISHFYAKHFRSS